MEPTRRLKRSRIPHTETAEAAELIKNPEPVESEAGAVAEPASPVKRRHVRAVRSLAPSVAASAPSPADRSEPIAEYAGEEAAVAAAATEAVNAFAPADMQEASRAFTDSLEDLTADEINPDAKDARGGIPVLTITRVFLILLCLGIFAYCAYVIGRSFIDYGRTDAIYGTFADEFFNTDDNDADSNGSSRLTQISADVSAPTASHATDGFVSTGGYVYKPAISSNDNPFDTNPRTMIQKLQVLSEKAPDLYGWIYIEGTRINYPVVQTTDNSYYLNHSADKYALQTGAIFADFRCNADVLRNFNTVLYGHNIRSGSMFHDVEKMYKDQKLFNNSTVILCTATGIFYYKPFTVFKASYDSGYNETGFPSRDAFASFAQKWQKNSAHANGQSIGPGDLILTLSTCTNGIATERYAVMCVLFKYEFAY